MVTNEPALHEPSYTFGVLNALWQQVSPFVSHEKVLFFIFLS